MRPALALLSDFLTSFQYSGTVHVVAGSAEALGLFLNLGQHHTQHLAVEHAKTLDKILAAHPDLNISIQHAKRDPTLVGFKRTRHLLLEAISWPLRGRGNLKSAKFQLANSKVKALQDWEQQFYDSPRLSQVYDSTLTSPPDGRPHAILRIASVGIRVRGQKHVHRVPRDIQSTLFRLITGHAFTGAYCLKFKHPNLPPATEEEIACACGAVPGNFVIPRVYVTCTLDSPFAPWRI
jgi:hypothetical protein